MREACRSEVLEEAERRFRRLRAEALADGAVKAAIAVMEESHRPSIRKSPVGCARIAVDGLETGKVM